MWGRALCGDHSRRKLNPVCCGVRRADDQHSWFSVMLEQCHVPHPDSGVSVPRMCNFRIAWFLLNFSSKKENMKGVESEFLRFHLVRTIPDPEGQDLTYTL